MSPAGRTALAACALMSVGLVPAARAAAVEPAPSGHLPGAPYVTPSATTAVKTHADFDGDGYDDLLVAAPGEGTGTVSQTGAITVIPGGHTGLVGGRALTLTPCSAGVPGPCAAGDQWGISHTV